jgi:hypothetical protein
MYWDIVGAAVGTSVGEEVEDICIYPRLLKGNRPLRAGNSFEIKLSQAATAGEWNIVGAVS